MKVWGVDKDKVRAEAGEGKLPVVTFMAGDRKVLLPNGQWVNRDRYLNGPSPLTGKEARKLLKKAKREARASRVCAIAP